MSRSSGTRIRMLTSASALIRANGVEGTGFGDVLKHSGAPRGSVYHHFPGGREQLAEEATTVAGEMMVAALEAALAKGDVLDQFDLLVGMWTAIPEASDYREGCPIAAAALTSNQLPGARRAAAATFARLEELLTEAFGRNGVGAERARSLATISIAAVEGALVLARAEGTSDPIARVSSELRTLLTAALAPAGHTGE